MKRNALTRIMAMLLAAVMVFGVVSPDMLVTASATDLDHTHETISDDGSAPVVDNNADAQTADGDVLTEEETEATEPTASEEETEATEPAVSEEETEATEPAVSEEETEATEPNVSEEETEETEPTTSGEVPETTEPAVPEEEEIEQEDALIFEEITASDEAMAAGTDGYYTVISERSWDIAPGIKETEVVLNNATGSRRQVLHNAIVDLNNPYTKVIAGYKGMWPKEGNYGVESTSVQAKNAEKLGYGNVVVATNTTLSWYTEAYYKENPHLIGEPLGYTVLDGQYYTNSRGHGVGASTVIVINYDKHPLTGEDRPADMPKVWIRNSTDPLTGWEEQAIPVSFTYLVKPDPVTGEPVNQYQNSDKHGNSDIASRTFVGVKEDGTLIITVSDGEQAPYSTGFSSYEMADHMIDMGCIIAANCDGGGSTTFCSQRPGEDFKINCSLADGGERPTTSTILVISTAPADGEFARATITSDYDYYTPGSSVTFNAMGTDAVGTKVDIPADVQWTVKEDGMGTVENGVFTSSGTEGTATIQMVHNGTVVGERSITIATPEAISFDQPVVTIPFGKTAKIPVKATIGGGVFEIGLGANDVTFTTTNEALGRFEGLNFIAVDEENAPADITSTVTATLNMGANPTATVQLNLGRASQVLWDFEGGQKDIDVWNVINNRKNAAHWDYDLKLSLADKTNGQVHDGNYSMRLETNGLSSKDSHAEQYAWIRLGVDGEAMTLKNARSVGFWLYVPEDNVQCMVQGHYMTDANNDGVFDTEAIVNLMEQEDVYYTIDESGWHYLSMDISAFEEVALKAAKQYDKDPSDGMSGETGEFFLALIFHKATNNLLWSENGSINGNYTYYLDNFTVDYSEAVEDRENPVFNKIYLDGNTALIKRDVVTTNNNVLNLSATVADASVKLDANKNEVPLHNASGLDPETAKAYIDGVEVESAYANGKITAKATTVADGYHRVKFEIRDKAGNWSSIVRVVEVKSGAEASTLKLVPADKTLDRIPFGSIYWMNLEANAIETIQSVSAVIDLNNVNHWQLDHMELAAGFTAEYTIAKETNTATITITRTGENTQTGKATVAKLPVRIVYFDTDIKTPGYTAQTYWTQYPFWPQDMKMDVDKGLITHVDGTTSTFSNEEFHVDTEMFTDKPHMAQVDNAYLNAHGTTHVHTPVALKDKAATCNETGYTGRTFCEGCNSPVEWGTTLPASGHVYKVSGDKLVCQCGEAFTGTGLQIIDGKGYYAISGTLTTGWVTVNDDWYYFDASTYASVPTYYNGYVTFKFEADGKLISGEWHKTAAGIRYYEGPSYIRGGKSVMTWYEIDGNTYCIDKYGYVATGTRWVDDDNTGADTYTWYNFDENGVCQGRWLHNGLTEWNGNLYYLKDGISQYGMYLVDGDYYYFYFTNKYAGIKNQSFQCNYNKGLLPSGVYQFGHDGKMVNNNVYNVDGVLYYYVKGKVSQGTGTFTYNGEEYTIQSDGKVLYTGVLSDASGKTVFYADGVESVKNGFVLDTDGERRYYVDGTATYYGLIRDDKGDYYYIDASLKAVKNGTYAVDAAKTNGLLPAGNYEFDATGKMIDPPYVECATHTWGQWKVTKKPTEAFVGIETRNCKLCNAYETREVPKLDCAHSWGVWITTTPATTTATGVQTRMCPTCGASETQVLPIITSTVKNGLIKESNGDVRYYVDGKATRAGLVMDDQGNYYYINSSMKAVKNCTYAFNAAMSNGLLPAGTYQFDAEGKMVTPPIDLCVIHFWSNWKVKTPATTTAAGQETRTCYYCRITEGRDIPVLPECEHEWSAWEVTTPATYTSTGVETRTCGKCGVSETREIPKLVCTDHAWGEWEVTTPATDTTTGVETRTCNNCGATETREIPAATCNHTWGVWITTTAATATEKGVQTKACTRCGETQTQEIPVVDTSVKNGLVKESNGDVRYYVDGKATRAGLVMDDQGNYYYINSSLKAVKNCAYAFSAAMSNGLLPAGKYQFDAEGKMVNPPVATCTAHFWCQWKVTTPATENTTGVETRTCYYCRATETQTIPALGVCEHSWSTWTVTTPATYTATGVESRTCGNCGATETREIPKLVCTDHAWGGWKVTKPATTTATGVETRTCGNCGATENRDIPMLDNSLKQGLIKDADGNIRYYVDGKPTRAGLVQDAEGNYYYINSTLKAVKNCTYAFSAAMSNGLLPAGSYQFDAEGKLILNN